MTEISDYKNLTHFKKAKAHADEKIKVVLCNVLYLRLKERINKIRGQHNEHQTGVKVFRVEGWEVPDNSRFHQQR